MRAIQSIEILHDVRYALMLMPLLREGGGHQERSKADGDGEARRRQLSGHEFHCDVSHDDYFVPSVS